ncbi:MAG: hypothetical protein AAFQ98_10615 [Bacteroidota bacterium]
MKQLISCYALIASLLLGCNAPEEKNPQSKALTQDAPTLAALQVWGDSLAARLRAYPRDAFKGQWSIQALHNTMQAYGLPERLVEDYNPDEWEYNFSELLTEYLNWTPKSNKNYAGFYRYYHDSLGAAHMVLHTHNLQGAHIFDFTVAQEANTLAITDVYLYDMSLSLSALMVRKVGYLQREHFGYPEVALPLRTMATNRGRYYATFKGLVGPRRSLNYDYEVLHQLPKAFRKDPAWHAARYRTAASKSAETRLQHLNHWEARFPGSPAALFYRNQLQTESRLVSGQQLASTLDALEKQVGLGPSLVHDRLSHQVGQIPTEKREANIREAIATYPNFHPLYYRLIYVLAEQQDWDGLALALTDAYQHADLSMAEVDYTTFPEFLETTQAHAVADAQGLSIEAMLYYHDQEGEWPTLGREPLYALK